MDLLLAFLAFAGAIIYCLCIDIPLSAGLLAGLAVFTAVGLHRGFTLSALWNMVYRSRKTSFLVCQVLFLIGCLTALWRASGTIAFFVYYGIHLITPHLFLLIAFLLSAALSYALGSSFGTVGTVGVMLMTLARSGNVDVLMTAGAVMSGAFFGERCSPLSSAALLISAVTGVEHNRFLKTSFRIGLLPLGLTTLIYAVMSWQNPIQNIDANVVAALQDSFYLGWPVMIPAVLLVILPLCRVRIVHVILVSGAAAFLLTVSAQQQSLLTALADCVVGYQASAPALKNIFSGGGVVSMLNVIFIIALANGCAGIFQGTDMLQPLQCYLDNMFERLHIFPSQILLSLFLSCVFCNQTIGITLITQMTSNLYRQHDLPQEELAADLNNSVVTIAALVPWSIACAVPLSVMHVGVGALPYSVFLYLVPLCYLLVRRKHYCRS